MASAEHHLTGGEPGPLSALTQEAALPLRSGAVPQVRSRPSSLVRLLRNPKARLGGGLLLLVVVAAIAAPVLTPYAPEDQDIRQKLLPPAGLDGGGWDHPLGTDQLGRDLLARVLYGARMSLVIGSLATVLAAVLGVVLGILAGYFGGRWDAAIMRIVDVQLAFPAILLALAVMVMLGPGLSNLILVLGITSWILFSRIIRADVLSFRHREFMEAGTSIGATHPHLIRHYVCPNLVGTISVLVTLTLARTIISESSLSFLGLGIEPPTPSWGGMLSEGRSYLSVAWWITTFPGVALMITVIGVSLLGDALRDVLDPRLHDDH